MAIQFNPDRWGTGAGNLYEVVGRLLEAANISGHTENRDRTRPASSRPGPFSSHVRRFFLDA